MKRSSIFIAISFLIIIIGITWIKSNANTFDGKTSPHNQFEAIYQRKLHSEYISDHVIERIKSYISVGREEELFQNFAAGIDMNLSMLSTMQIEHREFVERMLQDPRNSVKFIDIDNDGEKEIVVYADSGGSGGFAISFIKKKAEDGVYRQSGALPQEKLFMKYESHAFICIDGKNYLITRNRKFETKANDGFVIYAFNKGKFVEYVELSEYSNQVTITQEFISDNKYLQFFEKNKIKEAFSSCVNYEEAFGDLETKITKEAATNIVEKYLGENIEHSYYAPKELSWYEVDFNNDGIKDYVGKRIIRTGSRNFASHLYGIAYRNNGTELAKTDFDKLLQLDLSNCNLRQLCFYRVDNKNYAVTICQRKFENTYDYAVYLIENEEVKKIGSARIEYLKEINKFIHAITE